MKISELDEASRPREVFEAQGKEALKDEELLAIILGSGIPSHNALDIARSLLRYGGSLPSLCTISKKELLSFKGIGKAQAMRLLSVFELYSRLDKSSSGLPASSDPSDIASFFLDLRLEQEEAWIILLSPSHKIMGRRLLSKGGEGRVSFSVSVLLKEVLSSGFSHYALVHNHPSGEPAPSISDFNSLAKLDTSSRNVGIEMVDFIIVAEGGYFSYKESLKGGQ